MLVSYFYATYLIIISRFIHWFLFCLFLFLFLNNNNCNCNNNGNNNTSTYYTANYYSQLFILGTFRTFSVICASWHATWTLYKTHIYIVWYMIIRALQCTQCFTNSANKRYRWIVICAITCTLSYRPIPILSIKSTTGNSCSKYWNVLLSFLIIYWTRTTIIYIYIWWWAL